MDIENQVTCRELSQDLKEAGYPQDDSEWVYLYNLDEDYYELWRMQYLGEGEKYYVAPTVAELGEKLIGNEEIWVSYMNKKDKKFWTYLFHCEENDEKSFSANTEADARAKMWLYLKEKGLL